MKTDNSYFEEKVLLRLEALEKVEGDIVRVLEMFAGKSLLWQEVRRRTSKAVSLLSIEKEKGKNPTALTGDNMKFVDALDLDGFDIIDINAYGSCFRQLDAVLSRGYRGTVIVTDIQSVYGRTSQDLLRYAGFTDGMLKSVRSVIDAHAEEALYAYLESKGVYQVTGFFFGRKRYFYFNV